MQDIIAKLTAKDDKYACAIADRIISESWDTDEWYEYFVAFASLLNHPKSLVRNRVLHILAVNVQWDDENRFVAILPEFLSHIMDEKPITARQCIKTLAIIGQAKPQYIPRITEALREADLSQYKDSMRPLIEKDIGDTNRTLQNIMDHGGKNMKIESCIKESFSVIGKEGSTEDGAGFVQNLWADANSHFAEVAHLAKKDESGNLAGIWGAMTDFSRTFQPWEDGFNKGLYLAGIECPNDAEPPKGWTKWIIPGFEYLYAECDRDTVFSEMIAYLEEHNMTLAGAVHDFTCPQTGRNYMFFPIRKL